MTVETSLAFPLFELDFTISYQEVKKPTGISYFLLVLFTEEVDRSESLSQLLTIFGVPDDLQDLFADEIKELLANGLLEMNKGKSYRPRQFKDHLLGDFSLTSTGKKIFAEEMILTGRGKEIGQQAYYDPVTDTYKNTEKKQYGSIDKTYLENSFFERHKVKDFTMFKDFVERNKAEYGIKDKERITKIEVHQQESKFVKNRLEMIFSREYSVTLEFEDKAHETFYDKYLSEYYLVQELLLKNKFKFPSSKIGRIKREHIEGVVELHLPEALPKLLQEKSLVTIAKDKNLVPDMKKILVDKEYFKRQNHLEFIKIDEHHNGKGYVCGIFGFRDEKFDLTYPIPVIVVVELPDDYVEDILKEQIEKTKDLSDPLQLNRFVELSKSIQDLDCAKKIIDNYVARADTRAFISNGVQLAGKLKKQNEELHGHIHGIIEDYYKNDFKAFDLARLTDQLSLGKPLFDYFNKSTFQQVEKIFSNVAVSTPKEKLRFYSVMSQNGYDHKDILPVCNVIDLYAEQVLNGRVLDDKENKLAVLFGRFSESFNRIRGITGIDSNKELILREDMDTKHFSETYHALVKTYQDIDGFSRYDKERFNDFKAYMDLFKRIKELIDEEQRAMNDTKSMTKKYIKDKITQDSLSALIRLTVKLEYVLKQKMKVKTQKTLADLINDAAKREIVNDRQRNDLHRLRKHRNNLAHDSDDASLPTHELLEKWCDLVFMIEEVKA
jgi:hypothetical protein